MVPGGGGNVCPGLIGRAEIVAQFEEVDDCHGDDDEAGDEESYYEGAFMVGCLDTEHH